MDSKTPTLVRAGIAPPPKKWKMFSLLEQTPNPSGGNSHVSLASPVAGGDPVYVYNHANALHGMIGEHVLCRPIAELGLELASIYDGYNIEWEIITGGAPSYWVALGSTTIYRGWGGNLNIVNNNGDVIGTVYAREAAGLLGAEKLRTFALVIRVSEKSANSSSAPEGWAVIGGAKYPS